MRVYITLEHNYGHPDNRPSKQSLLQAFAEKLPKAIEQIDSDTVLWLKFWVVTKIEVE